MRRYSALIILCVLIYSCNYLYGIEDLGSGFFLDNGRIVHSTEDKYNGIGNHVFPQSHLLLSYNYDNKFILYSTGNKSVETSYWIILKELPSNNYTYIKDSIYSKTHNSYFEDAYYQYDNIIGPLPKPQYNNMRIKLNIPNSLQLVAM